MSSHAGSSSEEEGGVGRMGTHVSEEEGGLQPGFAPAISDRSNDEITGHFRLRFEQEFDEWVHLSGEGGHIAIKLTDARDKELREEHQVRPDSSVDIFNHGMGVDLVLLDMLKHARRIRTWGIPLDGVENYYPLQGDFTRAEGDENPGPADDLSGWPRATHVLHPKEFVRLLESEANPVPVLESLNITCPRSREESICDIRPIFGAMNSGKLMKLTLLDFAGFCVIDEQLRCLVDIIRAGCLPCLAKLHLSWNNFGSVGVKYMARFWDSFPSLQSLALKRTQVGDGGHVALAEAMMQSPGNLLALDTLDLSYSELGCVGCEAYAKTMTSTNLPALKNLRLGGNWVGEGGHLALTKAMESRHLLALENLNLNNTGMGSASCQAYAKNMSSGNLPALQILVLSGNEVGDIGASALGLACGSGKVNSLTHMDLDRNEIGDEGMIALATSFTVPEPLPNLRILYLERNKFTRKGLSALLSVLTSGHLNSLRSLYIQGNSSIVAATCAKDLVAVLAENNALDCEIRFEWHKFPTQDLLRRQFQERNHRIAPMLAELGSVIPATFGKVYLCGNPLVGKTTLRSSMGRSFLQSLCIWEGLPQKEIARTTGIEVSELFSKGKQGENDVKLAVWDMAGQAEYHMVHSAFFPDLALAAGKATTFILVAKHEDVEGDKLKYWLQFISSSCGNQIPRKVLVVLNCFAGDPKSREVMESWKSWLQEQSITFKEYLDIQTDPFIVDVRKRRSVKLLKRSLIDHSRRMLDSEMVPTICQLIQKNLTRWREERDLLNFPVLGWEDFVKKVQKGGWNGETRIIEYGTKYLNECGILLYIRKEFPPPWNIPMKRFVVLDPNWFCKDIVGNMFLPEHLISPKEKLTRKRKLKVNKSDGSISLTNLQEFFMSLHQSDWSVHQVNDLVAILLWLGLCYEGNDHNVFIPALIEQSEMPEYDGKGEWVMGYSVEHKENALSLAPIALWHRFQVDLAKCPDFNGTLDKDFVVGQFYITFKANGMNVLINVDASEDSPAFHSIKILVKPLWSIARDYVDSVTRKERQVDLAGFLVETLLRLWNQVCPGAGYVHRVVWPWPASREFGLVIPQRDLERHLEVKEVKKFIEDHGFGVPLENWRVGDDPISAEQLLSKKEFKYIKDSIEGNVNKARESVREAEELEIFPQNYCKGEDGAQEVGIGGADEISLKINELVRESQVREIAAHEISTGIESIGEMQGGSELSQVLAVVKAEFKEVRAGVHEVKDLINNGVITRMDVILKEAKEARNDLKMVMNALKDVCQKIENVGKFLLEDKERSCPSFIYVGLKNSGKWVPLKMLKESVSVLEKVHLHFLCEAQYDNQGKHVVEHQEGLDISHLKDWAKTILPWMKVSLTVLLISAKVAANAVAPGLGLIIPDFTTWQQALSISDGIALATGYSKQELSELTKENIKPGVKSTPKSPQELQGAIRKAMTELLEALTPSEYKKKLGLQKVSLQNHDGSFHSVAWICTDCYRKYGHRVRDLH